MITRYGIMVLPNKHTQHARLAQEAIRFSPYGPMEWWNQQSEAWLAALCARLSSHASCAALR